MKSILPTYANWAQVKRTHPQARRITKKLATFYCNNGSPLLSLNHSSVQVLAVDGSSKSYAAFIVFETGAGVNGIYETDFAHLLEGDALIKEIGLTA